MATVLFRAHSKDALISLLIQNNQSVPNKMRNGIGKIKACIVYKNKSEYENKISTLIERLKTQDEELLDLKSGLYFSTREINQNNISFIFPGQGSQYPGMLKNELDQETLKSMLSSSVENQIDLEKIIDTDQIDLTEFSQPALAVTSFSMLQKLIKIGITAPFSAGHSFGELTALAYSGAFDSKTFMEMSIKRGEIMGRANNSAPGKMLAIIKTENKNWEELHQELKSKRLVQDSDLANINTHSQIIYSGTEERIYNLKKDCEKNQIKNIVLNAGAAFHSPLMANASIEFKSYLNKKLPQIMPIKRAVISSTKSFSYSSSESIRDNLSHQLTSSINWINATQRMKDLGVKLFIEIGPKSVLSKMVKEILPEKEYLAFSMDKTPIENIKGYLESIGIQTIEDNIEPIYSPNNQTKENVIIKGFIQKQNALVHELEKIKDKNLRKAISDKIKSDTEEVLARYFSIENITPEEEDSPRKIESDEKTRIVLEEISKVTGFEINKIKLDSKFDEELYLDSITKIELLSSLSEKFQTKSNDITSLLNASSVQELIEIIKSKDQHDKDKDDFSTVTQWMRREISNYTGIKENKISPTTRFNEDLMLDSLIKMDLIGGLQSNFPDLKIELNIIHKFNTLKDFDEHFVNLKQKNSAPATIQKPSNVTIREMLAAHLGQGIEKVLTTSDFEHDLHMNIFDKEDFINSLIVRLPYLQLAVRELLHTKTFGDVLELEKIFDRRSPNRNDEEEIQRFTFELKEVLVSKNDLNPMKSQYYIASKASSDWLNDLLLFFSFKSIKLNHLKDIAQDPSPALLIVFDDEWANNLETAVDKAYKLINELITYIHGRETVDLTLITIGKNRYSESLIGLFRSLSKEYSLNISILKLTNDQLRPKDIPWGLLSNTKKYPKYIIEENGRFFIETPTKSSDQKISPLDNFDHSPHILLIGGGRGIASEIAKFLADNKHARISVLGRTKMGETIPFSDCQTDQDLRAKLKTSIDKLYPDISTEERVLLFNKELTQVNNEREIWKTKISIENRGGKFQYYQIDATQKSEFNSIIEVIEKTNGPVQGIIHAAGLTRDNLFKNKTIDEFKEVIFSKIKSAENVSEYFKNRQNLAFVCFFSSLSSWSGAPGQTDYSWSNEMINLISRDWNKQANYPVTSLLWSVWSETGLAKESLLTQMKQLKLAGITNSAGIRLFKEELFQYQFSSPKVLITPSSTLKYSLEGINGKS